MKNILTKTKDKIRDISTAIESEILYGMKYDLEKEYYDQLMQRDPNLVPSELKYIFSLKRHETIIFMKLLYEKYFGRFYYKGKLLEEKDAANYELYDIAKMEFQSIINHEEFIEPERKYKSYNTIRSVFPSKEAQEIAYSVNVGSRIRK